MCIADSSAGTGDRRARTTSLKQHQGGMQGLELGFATENHTIFRGGLPPPVANSVLIHMANATLFLRPAPACPFLQLC